MPIIFVLFVAVPIIEIALLVQVGSIIGTFNTIAIVIITAILGTWLLRQQGMATLLNAQLRMQSGEMPATQIIEGVLLLVGGVLLLTPGFVTDAIGFFCLIPYSRRWLASRLAARSSGWVVTSMTGGGFGHSASRAPGSANRSGHSRRTSEGDVLEGEYRREDAD